MRHPLAHRLRNLSRPALGLLLLSAALGLAYTATAVALDVTTSFSSKKDGSVPTKTGEREFTCSDTIYALIEAAGLEPGTHQVEIQWIDPRGDRQELTQFSVQVAEEKALIWGWMRLHPPENSGLVRTFDPSHGMRIFIGKWTVKIYIDDEHVATSHFDVLC